MIGWSEKNGTSLRGLWGIGRLAGLAYCKQLIFRTKAQGEDIVSRIHWDGQKFRELLSVPHQQTDLSEIVERIITTSSESVDRELPSFFEVQINQVVRHGNDALLNKKIVSEYLAQVAPVPFHVDAPFREQIKEFLALHIDVSGYPIHINGESEPIYKPHRNEFFYSPKHQDRFSDVECFEVKSRDNKPVAVGWILHHSYLGTLKNCPTLRGIRVRSGNMQIGNEHLLSSIFPEERFNNWSIGEIHILDPMLRPNGQRSNLEDTPAFRDFKSRLVPIVGRTIAKKCRMNSRLRNKARLATERLKMIAASLDILEANILSSAKVNAVLAAIEQEMQHPQSDLTAFPQTSQKAVAVEFKRISDRLKRLPNINKKSSCLSSLPKTQLHLVNNIADLIYDHSPDHKVAGELIFHIQFLLSRRRIKKEKKRASSHRVNS